MSAPIFSVIVPIHNRAHLIADCVASILKQTFPDFELILVDNNSSDNLRGSLARFPDSRIKLINCETPGPSAARMAGVAASCGKYLSFIDSDDIWRDDVLFAVYEVMESNRKPTAVYLAPIQFRCTNAISWDRPTGNVDRYANNFLQAILMGAVGAGALAGAKRELFEDGAGFNEDLWVGEDLDWALRKAESGPVCMLQSEPRLGYRRHDDNITKDTTRYETWVGELLGFAKSGRYATEDNPELRELIVKHLIGQLQTILCMRNFRPFLCLYPRVAALGLRWRLLRPLLMPTLFAAYFGKRCKILK